MPFEMNTALATIERLGAYENDVRSATKKDSVHHRPYMSWRTDRQISATSTTLFTFILSGMRIAS